MTSVNNGIIINDVIDCSDDGDACLVDREICLIEETCDDSDCQQRIDMGTPTPQSPRPPSAGNCLAIIFIISCIFLEKNACST